MQTALAVHSGAGPANTNVVLTPEQRRGLPYGEQVQALRTIDWDTANARRQEWTWRWNREVER